MEDLDNRGLAAEAYKEALKIDVFCSQAFQVRKKLICFYVFNLITFCFTFQSLIQHQALTGSEEVELLKSMPFEKQCNQDEVEVISFFYKMKLKKYSKPGDLKVPERLRVVAERSPDIRVQMAERHFYNCDYAECYKTTSGVMAEDPYHNECLPVHISCLVQLNYSNRELIKYNFL